MIKDFRSYYSLGTCAHIVMVMVVHVLRIQNNNDYLLLFLT